MTKFQDFVAAGVIAFTGAGCDSQNEPLLAQTQQNTPKKIENAEFQKSVNSILDAVAKNLPPSRTDINRAVELAKQYPPNAEHQIVGFGADNRLAVVITPKQNGLAVYSVIGKKKLGSPMFYTNSNSGFQDAVARGNTKVATDTSPSR
jgi:hypothetical protein